MEHRHEVALAAAEAAVQVRRLAGAGGHRALDEIECPIEGAGELRRHDVGPQRLGGPRHALGEPEDEVVAVDLLGDVDQVADQRHAGLRDDLIETPPQRPVFPPLGAGPGVIGAEVVAVEEAATVAVKADEVSESPAVSGGLFAYLPRQDT